LKECSNHKEEEEEVEKLSVTCEEQGLYWLETQEHWIGNCPPYITEILLKNGVKPNKNKNLSVRLFVWD